jgi:hypothetical protein
VQPAQLEAAWAQAQATQDFSCVRDLLVPPPIHEDLQTAIEASLSPRSIYDPGRGRKEFCAWFSVGDVALGIWFPSLVAFPPRALGIWFPRSRDHLQRPYQQAVRAPQEGKDPGVHVRLFNLTIAAIIDDHIVRPPVKQ